MKDDLFLSSDLRQQMVPDVDYSGEYATPCGTLRLFSPPGQGATVEISIPLGTLLP